MRNIEYDMKQKELEIELHRLEEEMTLKLEYEREALDARGSGSEDGAVLSIKSRSPFNWKSPRSKDVFGWLDKSDKFTNFKDCSLDHTRNGHDNYRVSFDRENLLKDPQAESVLNWRKYTRVAGMVEHVCNNSSLPRHTWFRENEPSENIAGWQSRSGDSKYGLLRRSIWWSLGFAGTEVSPTLPYCWGTTQHFAKSTGNTNAWLKNISQLFNSHQ